jgi:hypothetical protein
MMMNLKLDSRQGKFGVVFQDGIALAIISDKELADLHASGSGWPSILKQEDWESGACSVFGYDVDVGDVQTQEDGSALVKYAHEIVDGKFIQSFVVLKPLEFTGSGDTLDVAKSVSDKLPIEISKGILTVKPVQVLPKAG